MLKFKGKATVMALVNFWGGSGESIMYYMHMDCKVEDQLQRKLFL